MKASLITGQIVRLKIPFSEIFNLALLLP